MTTSTVYPTTTTVASRAWELTGWTYHMYDFLDCESAMHMCTVNHWMYDDFHEKYMRWKNTYTVSGKRKFIQARTGMGCDICTANDDDFNTYNANRGEYPGKSYILCKNT